MNSAPGGAGCLKNSLSLAVASMGIPECAIIFLEYLADVSGIYGRAEVRKIVKSTVFELKVDAKIFSRDTYGVACVSSAYQRA